jgi:prevent-host-death family protein
MLGMAVIVTVEEAQDQFDELIDRVLNGEEIVITQAGEPVARIVPALDAEG